MDSPKNWILCFIVRKFVVNENAASPVVNPVNPVSKGGRYVSKMTIVLQTPGTWEGNRERIGEESRVAACARLTDLNSPLS